MNKIDKFSIGETVRNCTDRFKAYLPPELRPRLDDLVELYEGEAAINEDAITEKGMRYFNKAFSRLAAFFKSNPLITDSLPPRFERKS